MGPMSLGRKEGQSQTRGIVAAKESQAKVCGKPPEVA